MSGIELVGTLTRIKPKARCLMLSAHPLRAYGRGAMGAGARGYIEKSNILDMLSDAIGIVMAGGSILAAL